jgi:hypothetical protein
LPHISKGVNGLRHDHALTMMTRRRGRCRDAGTPLNFQQLIKRSTLRRP